MGSHHDDIKNEIAYFHKVIKNMDLKDNIKSSKINEYEIPIEEIMYDTFSNGFDVEYLKTSPGKIYHLKEID